MNANLTFHLFKAKLLESLTPVSHSYPTSNPSAVSRASIFKTDQKNPGTFHRLHCCRLLTGSMFSWYLPSTKHLKCSWNKSDHKIPLLKNLSSLPTSFRMKTSLYTRPDKTKFASCHFILMKSFPAILSLFWDVRYILNSGPLHLLALLPGMPLRGSLPQLL